MREGGERDYGGEEQGGNIIEEKIKIILGQREETYINGRKQDEVWFSWVLFYGNNEL